MKLQLGRSKRAYLIEMCVKVNGLKNKLEC